jgi:tRNA-dihydrouridine synthase
MIVRDFRVAKGYSSTREIPRKEVEQLMIEYAEKFTENKSEALYHVGKQMRHYQQKYFETRSESALQKSKQYEREFDKLIAGWRQMSLFV